MLGGRECRSEGRVREGIGGQRAAAGEESKGRNPKGEIVLTDCGSVGFCSIGTAVLVYPEGVWYAQVTADDVHEIIEEHLEKGNIVERLALIDMSKGDQDV